MRKSLLELSAGWGKKNRKTKPLRNSLKNRAASVMTKNQLMKLLEYDPILLKNVVRALEHRAKNIQNENFQSFMKNYYRKRNLKTQRK